MEGWASYIPALFLSRAEWPGEHLGMIIIPMWNKFLSSRLPLCLAMCLEPCRNNWSPFIHPWTGSPASYSVIYCPVPFNELLRTGTSTLHLLWGLQGLPSARSELSWSPEPSLERSWSMDTDQQLPSQSEPCLLGKHTEKWKWAWPGVSKSQHPKALPLSLFQSPGAEVEQQKQDCQSPVASHPCCLWSSLTQLFWDILNIFLWYI